MYMWNKIEKLNFKNININKFLVGVRSKSDIKVNFKWDNDQGEGIKFNPNFNIRITTKYGYVLRKIKKLLYINDFAVLFIKEYDTNNIYIYPTKNILNITIFKNAHEKF